jgi:hypothetical protein
MDLFNAFAVDTEAQEKGTLTQIPGAGDTKWLIARAGNKNYAKLMNKLAKQNRAVLDSKGDAADAKAKEIVINVMAKTILLGFEGEITYKGKQFTYSEDLVKELLAHEEFRAAVSSVADDMNTFKAVKDEEDEKN